MCMAKAPKAPEAPPKLPEAPVTPMTDVDSASMTADQRRRRNAAGESKTSSILTGSRGVNAGAQTAVKTLLGQ